MCIISAELFRLSFEIAETDHNIQRTGNLEGQVHDHVLCIGKELRRSQENVLVLTVNVILDQHNILCSTCSIMPV